MTTPPKKKLGSGRFAHLVFPLQSMDMILLCRYTTQYLQRDSFCEDGSTNMVDGSGTSGFMPVKVMACDIQWDLLADMQYNILNSVFMRLEFCENNCLVFIWLRNIHLYPHVVFFHVSPRLKFFNSPACLERQGEDTIHCSIKAETVIVECRCYEHEA